MESVIRFKSDDTLDILCQKISIEEWDMRRPLGESSGDREHLLIRMSGEVKL